MKRKFADAPNWERIEQSRYYQEYVTSKEFEGYVTYLILEKVINPLFVNYSDENILLADDGYTWMMFFPKNELYAVTVMINYRYEIIQWYFDIIKSVGITDKGIPYLNDMYLDYILLSNGRLITKDEDELENARLENVITEEEYSTARKAGRGLKEELLNGQNKIVNDMPTYIEKLKFYFNRQSNDC